jgi:hypothetical protein
MTAIRTSKGPGARAVAHVQKTVTFTGAAGAGAQGTVALFTVTGAIKVDELIARCTTDLVGATAALSCGITSDTDLFLQGVTATDVDANDFWAGIVSARGVSTGANNGDGTSQRSNHVLINQDIVLNVVTADITAGVLVFDLFYWKVTSDGLAVAA